MQSLRGSVDAQEKELQLAESRLDGKLADEI